MNLINYCHDIYIDDYKVSADSVTYEYNEQQRIFRIKYYIPQGSNDYFIKNIIEKKSIFSLRLDFKDYEINKNISLIESCFLADSNNTKYKLPHFDVQFEILNDNPISDSQKTDGRWSRKRRKRIERRKAVEDAFGLMNFKDFRAKYKENVFMVILKYIVNNIVICKSIENYAPKFKDIDYPLIELLNRMDNVEKLDENKLSYDLLIKTSPISRSLDERLKIPFYIIDKWYMNSLDKNSAYYKMLNATADKQNS
jgi:hypothetical protein